LLAAYFNAISVKASTLLAYRQCESALVEHFGKAKPLSAIGPMQAEEWAKGLRDAEYAQATVSKMVKIARGIFGRGVKWKMVGESPFADVRAGSQRNPERSVFVPRETIAKVLDACPDAEWRLIVALCRYGGLRCPSEHQALKWGDVDWDQCRMLVRSSKTEHHAGGESRYVPVFPELMGYLRDAYERADDGAEWVIARYRGDNANLRTQLLRILARAGVKPWPRLLHNMRASRQTELHAEFPLADCCAWLGNSPAVASAHYIQPTDANFREATKRATGIRATGASTNAPNERGGANSGAQVVQKPARTGSAEGCTEVQSDAQTLADCTSTHQTKNPRTLVQGPQVGATGLETPTKSAGNTLVSETGGAESGAIDPDLAAVLTAWPTLPEHARRAVLAVVKASTDTTPVEAITDTKRRGR
jgi:integrase